MADDSDESGDTAPRALPLLLLRLTAIAESGGSREAFAPAVAKEKLVGTTYNDEVRLRFITFAFKCKDEDDTTCRTRFLAGMASASVVVFMFLHVVFSSKCSLSRRKKLLLGPCSNGL